MNDDLRLRKLSEELAAKASAVADISVGTPGDPNSIWTLVDSMANGRFDSALAEDLVATLEGAVGVILMAQEESENEDDGGDK